MKYSEQEIEAKRLIKKYGRYWMLYDDEAIGEIIETVMIARAKHNPEISKISTYLIKSVKNKMIKLNYLRYRKNKNTISLSDFKGTLEDYKEHNTEISDLIENTINLSPIEKDIIKKYYIESMTIVDIGKEYGFSKQRAFQYIQQGIKKLKERKYVLVEK